MAFPSTNSISGMRMGPTVQQGGTQTIQQSIYLSHFNPCGANQLIFQTMGLTKIRYVDLKDLLVETLQSDEMQELFQIVQDKGTTYMYNPTELNQTEFLHAISQWAQAGIRNIPVPLDNYPGYIIRFSVYDYSGAMIWDSSAPSITITEEVGGIIYVRRLLLFASNPQLRTDVQIYQIVNNPSLISWIDTFDYDGFVTTRSSFVVNQIALPESVMAIGSLLVDSANTRTFGIPRFGFSARTSSNGGAGIGYHCAHYMDINSEPVGDNPSTLINSLFVRISIEELSN